MDQVFGKVQNLKIEGIFEIFDFLDSVVGSDKLLERNQIFLSFVCLFVWFVGLLDFRSNIGIDFFFFGKSPYKS